MSESAFDVIVAGVGGVGAATCAALAERGARVLGLDAHGIPNRAGSSHGSTRAFRLCYYEHPDYVPLLQEALERWTALAASSSRPILRETGGLYLGPRDGPFIEGSIDAARRFDLPHEILDRAAVAQRFPAFAVPDGIAAFFEPQAAVLFPESIIAAWAEQACARGAVLRGHEPLASYDFDDDGVTVTTAAATYRATALVCCAGVWTNRIVRDLGAMLTPSRQIAEWLWPSAPERFAAPSMPLFGVDDPELGFWYGFPLEDRRVGLKVARHEPGSPCDPDTVDRHDLRVVGPRDAVLDRYLPGARGPVLAADVCMYMNTPDAHFVVDRHPDEPRLVVVTGLSGHGFKFASVLGQIAADLALDGATARPIGFLGLDRFRRGD